MARQRGGRVVFLSPENDEELSWSEFFAEAEQTAAWLQNARDIGPGSRVVVLALPSRTMATAVAATWMAGAGVSCPPTPARTTVLAAYVEQTLARVAALGDPLVLLGAPYDGLAEALVEGGARVDLLVDAVGSEPAVALKAPDLEDDDPAVFQFTSGTTSVPKIVRVSHGNLAANIAAIKDRGCHDEVHGRMLTWLPLSHDMGLIGAFALHLTCGHCDLLVGSPTDFLDAPSSWMQNAARYRATVVLGPAFAYALAGRVLKTGPVLDLSSVKVAMCGGEPIDPKAIEDFLYAAQRHGFRREAFLPAYGMAEATLAVTMPEPNTGLRVDEVDADTLAHRRLAVPAAQGDRAGRFTRLGTAVPGTRIRIVNLDTGVECPPRCVGEIEVSGASVAGYLVADGGDTLDERMVGRSPDGWLATGDLGYLADGELVVCGRAKDLIIIGGRNIHPEEVERAAATIPGVRPGNVVAFPSRRAGFPTERLTVALEIRPGHDEASVCDRVTAAVLATIGVRPDAVIPLSPGKLPKTPSGKLQRAEAARLWGAEET